MRRATFVLSALCSLLACRPTRQPLTTADGGPTEESRRTLERIARATTEGGQLICGYHDGRWYALNWKKVLVLQDAYDRRATIAWMNEAESEEVDLISFEYRFVIPPEPIELSSEHSTEEESFVLTTDARGTTWVPRDEHHRFEFNRTGQLTGWTTDRFVMAPTEKVRRLCFTKQLPPPMTPPEGLLLDERGGQALALSTSGGKTVVFLKRYSRDKSTTKQPLDHLLLPGDSGVFDVVVAARLLDTPSWDLAEIDATVPPIDADHFADAFTFVGWRAPELRAVPEHVTLQPDGGATYSGGAAWGEGLDTFVERHTPRMKTGRYELRDGDGGCTLRVELPMKNPERLPVSLVIGERAELAVDSRSRLNGRTYAAEADGGWLVQAARCDDLVDRPFAIGLTVGPRYVESVTESLHLGTGVVPQRLKTAPQRANQQEPAPPGECVPLSVHPGIAIGVIDGGVALLSAEKTQWLPDLPLRDVLAVEQEGLVYLAPDQSVRVRRQQCTGAPRDPILIPETCQTPQLAPRLEAPAVRCGPFAFSADDLTPKQVFGWTPWQQSLLVAEGRFSFVLVEPAAPDLVRVRVQWMPVDDSPPYSYEIQLPWNEYQGALLSDDGVMTWSNTDGEKKYLPDGGVERLLPPNGARDVRLLGTTRGGLTAQLPRVAVVVDPK